MEDWKKGKEEIQKMIFNEEQKKIIQKVGLNPGRFITDEDYDALEDRVSKYLMTHGFDENYQPTEVGKICESILDLLGDI